MLACRERHGRRDGTQLEIQTPVPVAVDHHIDPGIAVDVDRDLGLQAERLGRGDDVGSDPAASRAFSQQRGANARPPSSGSSHLRRPDSEGAVAAALPPNRAVPDVGTRVRSQLRASHCQQPWRESTARGHRPVRRCRARGAARGRRAARAPGPHAHQQRVMGGHHGREAAVVHELVRRSMIVAAVPESS